MSINFLDHYGLFCFEILKVGLLNSRGKNFRPAIDWRPDLISNCIPVINPSLLARLTNSPFVFKSGAPFYPHQSVRNGS